MKRSVCWWCFLMMMLFFAIDLRAKDVPVKPTIRDKYAWYDTANWLSEGQGWHTGLENHYARFPLKWKTRIVKETKPGLWAMSQKTNAGLFFRFRTNASEISFHYILRSKINGDRNTAGKNRTGVDLYGRSDDGKWLWCGCTSGTEIEATELIVRWTPRTMREYIVYLPLQGGLNKLEIGVPTKAEFHAVAPREGKSILYYGTSIANGGCASRPGMAYTAMLGRRLDIPVINLGFAGCGRMELVMADEIAEVDPLLYVVDCGPNMSLEMVQERIAKFFEQLRTKRPTTPILLVQDQGFSQSWIGHPMQEPSKKNELFRKIYQDRVDAGDENFYILSYFNMIGEDIDRDSTIDGQHLNDLGMYRMSHSLEKVIRPILEKEAAKKSN